MKLLRLLLDGHRSVQWLDFEAGPFTVLFGKNNAGKTNLLETLYAVFADDRDGLIRRTSGDRTSRPDGAMYVELEPGLPFDDRVVESVAKKCRSELLRVMLVKSGVVAGDPDEYYEDEIGEVYPNNWKDYIKPADSPHVLYLNWQVNGITARVEEAVAKLSFKRTSRRQTESPWLESLQPLGYRVPAVIDALVEQLGNLATDLLPDFVDGSIRAYVTTPVLWEEISKVNLEYDQRGLSQCADSIEAAGEGAARWMAAATQIALHLMEDYPDLSTLRDLGPRGFSGHVLLLDEPEAHLHPSAVASMVRWCERMVSLGFTVIAASHHEEFLRAPAESVTLVSVTRSSDLIHTLARTVQTHRVLELRRLASDVGMHPATILALHRAVLFVEGPLDEAVLDEYGGVELDAAGVKVVPVHGTKNLEGLVSVELVSGIGIKTGILTDATDPSTMEARSGRKRSSEERKVLRVIEIAKQKGLPTPTSFGVPEPDLLFAIPDQAIRDYLNGPFPGWKQLVEECRAAEGKGPSDSVDWKSYAFEHYALDIRNAAGVRDIIRKVDLAQVELPSISEVIKQVVTWACSGEAVPESSIGDTSDKPACSSGDAQ